MAKLQVEKRNGLFDLKPLYEWMRNALDGIYRIEVKKVRKPRSLDQNGWLFGCIYPILLDALLEAGWEFVSVEQVHEFFKAQMTADKVVNKHTGGDYRVPVFYSHYGHGDILHLLRKTEGVRQRVSECGYSRPR